MGLVSVGSLLRKTDCLIEVINGKPYLMAELIVTNNICFKFCPKRIIPVIKCQKKYWDLNRIRRITGYLPEIHNYIIIQILL